MSQFAPERVFQIFSGRIFTQVFGLLPSFCLQVFHFSSPGSQKPQKLVLRHFTLWAHFCCASLRKNRACYGVRRLARLRCLTATASRPPHPLRAHCKSISQKNCDGSRWFAEHAWLFTTSPSKKNLGRTFFPRRFSFFFF